MLWALFLYTLLCNNFVYELYYFEFHLLYWVVAQPCISTCVKLQHTLLLFIITCSGGVILVSCAKAGHRLVSLLFLCSVLA